MSHAINSHVLTGKNPIYEFRSVFPKFSNDKMTLCNNNNQTWFSDTLASARRLGGLKTLTLQAWVSTPPLGSSRC